MVAPSKSGDHGIVGGGKRMRHPPYASEPQVTQRKQVTKKRRPTYNKGGGTILFGGAPGKDTTRPKRWGRMGVVVGGGGGGVGGGGGGGWRRRVAKNINKGQSKR